MHDFRGSPKNENKKDEAYYYFRRPPTHSSVPVNPAEMHGPPPQVAPYFYYTDKDLEVLNGERDNRKVITTVSRQTDMFIGNSINKRVATSPLKSWIQNAEVKIARGGVAVSFDPWNDEKSLNKVSFFSLFFRVKSLIKPQMKENLNNNLTIYQTKMSYEYQMPNISTLLSNQ